MFGLVLPKKMVVTQTLLAQKKKRLNGGIKIRKIRIICLGKGVKSQREDRLSVLKDVDSLAVADK